MKRSLLLAPAWALLLPASALAQPSPAPNPSPSASPGAANTEYVLFLNPDLSQVLVSSIHLGTPQTSTDSSGCTVTGASDGAILCLTADSCGGTVPLCGITFAGQAGLTLPDVADLSTLPSPGPSGTPASALAALRRHRG